MKNLIVLRTYREALRSTRTFSNQPSLRAKLDSNIREIFEAYRFENDETIVKELLEMARHDIKVLAALGKETLYLRESLFLGQ